ncbi:MFS multidrug transporter-like protein [Delphinella strobiligena]|nr:MFS multidrug transporter-like protein [Delphinella strobiligena]
MEDTEKTATNISIDQERITLDVLNEAYEGQGTHESPYIVTWIEKDPGNPLQWSNGFRWWICAINVLVTLAVALNSSAFSGSLRELIIQFEVSTEIITLGISLFVLGFAVGPLVWAPLSELYGRQIIFAISYGGFTIFNIGAANAHSIEALLVMRFFAGAFGSSPFTNSGGAIADVFAAKERGLAMAFFALCPSLGPALGPVVGGFLSENQGWRWVQGLMAILSGTLWLLGMAANPETYAPVLPHRRAAKLSKMTGKVYKTRQDISNGQITVAQIFRTSLSRPLILLFMEPIVLLLSLYMAIIYGTLYLFFGAYPIVYQAHRGWSEGL